MQHTNAQTDPHDAIVAQLRELAPKSDIPADEAPAASPALVDAMPLHAAPLNDNAGDIHRLLAPRARTGRRVARGLLVVCVAAAAMTAWHSYGDAARQKLSEVVPQFLAGTPAAAQNSTVAGAQDSASQDTASSQTASSQDAVPVAEPQSASDAAPAQAASTATPETASPPQPPAPTAAQSTEPPAAQPAIPPELAQSIESMGREIASLRQELEQLKTGQDQLGREIAKAAEHEARQKPAAEASKRTPRPRRSSAAPAAPRTRASHTPSPRESQLQPYPQSYPQPAPQREAYIPPPPPPGDASVPRPPMPLR